MSVSDVFLDAEFKYVSRISLIIHTFRVASDYLKARAYIRELLGGL